MKIALIADIHEDIVNLKTALSKIEKLKCDEIICLGDISGFSIPQYKYIKSRNAHECLSLIKSNCKIAILGNHDMHAAQIIPRHCVFFNYPDNWYQLDYHDRHKLGNNVLWLHEEYDLNPLYKQSDLTYIKTLPEFTIDEFDGYKILFAHYIYPNITGLKKEFYTYADEIQGHLNFMRQNNLTLSFTGHSHTKGYNLISEKKFHHYRYIKKNIPEGLVCISIPPITSHNKRSGFCVFDTKEYSIQAIKI